MEVNFHILMTHSLSNLILDLFVSFEEESRQYSSEEKDITGTIVLIIICHNN